MGVDLTIVLEGLQHAFTVQNLIWLTFGVFLGLISGTLPGFSGGSMMAVLLPIILTLPLDTMLIALAGIYAANVYADSTTGILYNIPGGAAGIPATVEGYQLKQKGRLLEAFAAQVSGSFFGAMIGFLILLLLVPMFLYFVKFFGAGERALLAVWALVFIASGVITRGDPLRAYLSVGLGLALGLIGQQPNIGTFRFTLGLSGLWDGLAVTVLVLALFGLPQLLEMAALRHNFEAKRSEVVRVPFVGLYQRMAQLLFEARRVAFKSAIVGCIIGIIPGIGTSTAAWAGYSVAQRNTTQPEKFGEGNRDGVLGAESASNACEVGTIVPLLALGIPGSAAAAIMLAAVTIRGINPGPSMYVNFGAEVWTIIFGIGLSGVVFTILAYPFIVGAQYMSNLSVSLLVGAIGTLCVMGSYLHAHNLFGPYTFVVLGVATLFAMQLGLKAPAILIGFVLGPVIEKELIRSYQIGGFGRFLQPTALTILGIIAITVILAILRHRKDRVAAEMSAAQAAIAAEDGPAEVGTREGVEADPAAYLREKLLAVLSLAFAAFLLTASLSYELFASLWIYFIAAVFIIPPAMILLLRHLDLMSVAMSAWQALPKGQTDWRGIVEKTIVVLAFLSYIALITTLGFLLASALFVFGLVFYFERKLLRALFCGIGTAAALWLVLSGFQIYMPQGTIFQLY
jgi:putative tricarboxylic transport membrane protein